MTSARDEFFPPLDGEGGSERSEEPGGVIFGFAIYPHPGSLRSPALPARGREKR